MGLVVTPLGRSLSAQRREHETFIAQAGYAAPGSIRTAMTFRAWCEDLAAKGLKVDAKPFTLEGRPSLLPPDNGRHAGERWYR
jgi:hypothetical protein